MLDIETNLALQQSVNYFTSFHFTDSDNQIFDYQNKTSRLQIIKTYE